MTYAGQLSPDRCIEASIPVLLIDLKQVLRFAAEEVFEELTSLAPGDCPRLAIVIKDFAIVLVEDTVLCTIHTRCQAASKLQSARLQTFICAERAITIEACHLVV